MSILSGKLGIDFDISLPQNPLNLVQKAVLVECLGCTQKYPPVVQQNRGGEYMQLHIKLVLQRRIQEDK